MGKRARPVHVLVVTLMLAGCSRATPETTAPTDAAPAVDVPSAAPAALPTADRAAVQRARLEGLFEAIGANRNAPTKMKALEPPECTGDECTFGWDEPDDALGADVKYFRSSPSAVCFATHVPVTLTCEFLGGATVKSWPETSHSPSGSTCTFSSGPLANLQALIENNTMRDGRANSGLHIYSASYLAKDPDLAAGIRSDEARARISP